MSRESVYRALQALLVLLLTLAAIVTSGWVGDGLKGECLFTAWTWIGDCAPGVTDRIARVVPVVLVFLLVSYLTYRLAKTWVPVRHIAQGKTVRPHRVLIAPISLFKPLPEKDENDQWCVRERDKDKKIVREVVLSNDLIADIDAFSRKGWRWNGQQFLRGLLPHLQTAEGDPSAKMPLTDLVLIGSSGEASSHASLKVVRSLVALYTSAHIHPSEEQAEGIDFEEIQALQRAFDKWIRYFIDRGVPESEILLDTTGGQKTTSIAAALTTLRWRQVEFQYVESKDTISDGCERKPNVLGFNVVVDAPQHGGGL